MPNRNMILKQGIHRKCSVAMCQNSTVNSISRTSAPANASYFMCDQCLKEAYLLRFGPVISTDEVEAIKARNAYLQVRIAELTAELSKREGITETVTDEAKAPVTESKAEVKKRGSK